MLVIRSTSELLAYLQKRKSNTECERKILITELAKTHNAGMIFVWEEAIEAVMSLINYQLSDDSPTSEVTSSPD